MVRAVRRRNVFALVALCVHVHVEAHVEAARFVAAAPGALHHGCRGIRVLPRGTGPQAHLLTVAAVDAGEVETGVVVDLVLLVAHQRQHHGAVRGQHLLVVGEVARGQHDGLVRLEAHVAAAVHLGGHHARHAAALVAFALQVFGLRVVDDLDAVLLGLRLKRLHGTLLAGGHHGAVAQRGERMRVVRAQVERVVALHDDLEAVLAGDVDHPVHGLFGVVVAAHPLLLVDGERGGTHLVVVERDGVERLDAQLLHDL